MIRRRNPSTVCSFTAEHYEQMTEAEELVAAIGQNLEVLGYGE